MSKNKINYYNQLSVLVEKAQCVSIDFFGTLFIKSLTHDEDVFALLGENNGIKKFPELRLLAQQRALKRARSMGRQAVCLKDIYACFEGADYDAQVLMDAEYALELRLLKPNPEMLSLCCEWVRSGISVVIIEDTHLPADFFRSLLTAYGLGDIPLLLSAEQGVTKREHGGLFDVLIKQMQVAPQQILHIGDNPLADITRAQEKKLATFLYSTHERPVLPRPKLLIEAIAQGLLQYIGTEDVLHNIYVESGFRVGGPAQLGFVQWIKEQAHNDGIDQVLFTARSGSCVRHVGTANTPRYGYLAASQTDLLLAAITTDNFAEFIPVLLAEAHGLSPAAFLARIGVQPPAAELMAGLGLGAHLCINEVLYERMTHFLYAYQWKILQVCQSSRRNLFQELKRLNIHDGERVALVDVGWSGTTQEAFLHATQSFLKIDLYGYYFCLAQTAARFKRAHHQKMVAMIHEGNTPRTLIESIYTNRAVIEHFFFTPPYLVAREHQDLFERMPAPLFDEEIVRIIQDINKGADYFAAHFDLHIAALQMIEPLIKLAVNQCNPHIFSRNFYCLQAYTDVHQLEKEEIKMY